MAQNTAIVGTPQFENLLNSSYKDANRQTADFRNIEPHFKQSFMDNEPEFSKEDDG